VLCAVINGTFSVIWRGYGKASAAANIGHIGKAFNAAIAPPGHALRELRQTRRTALRPLAICSILPAERALSGTFA